MKYLRLDTDRISNKIFRSYNEMIDYLKKTGRLHEKKYLLNDLYKAKKDIGYPFLYWAKDTTMTLKEWVADSRKQLPNNTKDKTDLEIIKEILEKDSLWESEK